MKSVQVWNFFWSVFSRIWTEYGEILHIAQYSVRMQENTNAGKYGPEKNPYLDTFHAVLLKVKKLLRHFK